MSLQPSNMRIEEAMPTSDDSFYSPYQQPQPAYGVPYNSTGYDAATPHTTDYVRQPPPSNAGDDDETRAITERSEARDRAQAAQAAAKGGAGQPMRIRTDYVPRAQAKRQNVAMGICPNCRQQIPMNEMSEHMRSKNLPLKLGFLILTQISLVELLDPRWKEQRQKAESRSYNPIVIDTSASLKRLASQRGDDIGVGQPSAVNEEEEARRKRAAMGGEGMDISEQIRSIHQRYNQ